MSAFQDSLAIANRACDHLGVRHILSVDEDSTTNGVLSAAYDMMREAEMERNVWAFSKRKVILRAITATSRLLAPQLWNIRETYLPGAIVADANGDLWISWKADNYGNEPGVSAVWDSYFGPLSIDAWASGTTYYAGELVYRAISPTGAFGIFLSRKQTNSDTPDTSTPYSATATYGLNDRVSYLGSQWRSLITLNLGIVPVQPPANWSDGVTYTTGSTVVATDGFVYTGLPGVPAGLDPMDDDGTFWTRGVAAAWSADPVQYAASGNWLPIYANMINMPDEWLYVAPTSTQSGGGKSVFRYPNGALRRTKVGYRNPHIPDDFEPHGDYLTSRDTVILLEFAANIRDVRKMHAMFCEGLAVRLALSTCKALTGAEPNNTALGAEYKTFMTEARLVNAIDVGPEEPDEDEYVTVRGGGDGGFTNGSTNYWGNG